ncbi:MULTISPECIES: PrgI family protein [unclassified Faecalibacterium]|uniref:PrgI family protein n=1 Tax=unclassified Faecalibacterium TaxID=2646395 RepID=UPI000B3A4EE6|nr:MULTISPECIES: PrgI family protein [unclassified Faecalibacterium]OUP25128.1 PrgI family protein [Faecalibacterium sp. An192]OUQ39169.1 PrgI family protein [Faecalibacterium sp. An121]
MAAYISVPRDLTRVKSKVLFGLTKRQLICFGTGALIGVPVYFFVRAAGNLSLAALAMIVVMLPFFFLGLYERNGQPPEVVARQFYQARFVRPKVRPYRINNYYAALMRQADAQEEVNRIVQKAAERKARG